MRMTKRRWTVAAIALAIAALTVWALWPKPLTAEIARVTRGPLEVTIVEDGVARVRERYEVAAPVSGRLLRVEVHAGDAVEAGAALLRIDPAPLDPKQSAQLAARLQSAQRAASEAQALLRRAQDAARRARLEADRIRKLAAESVVSRDALEAATTAESIARRDQEAARFRAEATAYDVEVARAAFGVIAGDRDVVVRAPVRGRVLQVLRESETIVAAGTPLILVGDPATLETVADFLSTDAVRIRPGAEARVERWGGDGALAARVRLIEPAAFTKISALGVEEQR
ncbi:MAG TPA: HlyD family efflux transporter periplasmic adaptor subunit, partial [Thermoanaerobaculia bacterium]|nr:HlyD family efflux transporter periplasmic adaptor subunit [Thermoanaerobaculia bacterium]